MQQTPPKSSAPPTSDNLVQRYAPQLYAFWKFSRPHTILGTSFSTLGLYLLSLSTLEAEQLRQALIPSSLIALSLALFACLCGNVYIVGLNQLEDVDIDRVNKPHLPLASGDFSYRQAQVIVASAAILAVLLSLWQGYYLFLTVGLSLLIGTAYSLPPIRLKRFPFWASLCIFTVRGGVVNLGLFSHFSQLLKGAVSLPIAIWGLTAFILVFTFAIAIFKDIPDLEGDRLYNINTFTIRLGPTAVFKLARWVLTSCYLGMIVLGPWIPAVQPVFLIATHGLAIATIWWLSFRVDLTSKQEIARFYQFIWAFFFLEYLIFPIAFLL
jgi:homogentisate phytyltransferase/homogentisate geranylgeranyltransferase